LSRQGEIRVPIKENIKFSENEWYGYQNSFVSTNPNQNLIKISQNGTVSSTDLGLADNNRIVADRTNLVYLNENELSINSKIVNLDFGLYTDPQLFSLKNRTLITITDTQTQKVYVFNDKAELLEGFPVYGNSQVDIANADLDSKLELIVKGAENEILLYEF
ncbi:MAG: ribonuclease HII, partial [Christiangramia sp.]